MGKMHMQGQQSDPQAPAVPVRAIDISEVLAGIARRKRMILGITLLFAVAGTLFAMLARPVYTSQSQVLVEYQDSPYLRNPGVQQTQPRRVDERDVKSQVAVIESRDLALKVLHDLELVGTTEFDPVAKGLGLGTRLKILLGFKADPRRMTPEQRALQVWYENLKVYDLPRSRVIVIAYTSPNPQTAARIVNALAAAYVEQTRAAQLEHTSEARNWLKKQIEELHRKVVESEVAVERYRAKADLFQGTQAKLINQQLAELSTQITNARSERSRAEAEARAIREAVRNGTSLDNSPAVVRSPLIQRLREQQVNLQRQLAELSTVYLDNHPRVKSVKRQLAGLKEQIRREALKIARSLEQQAKIAATREAELRAAMSRLKKRASTAGIDDVKLRELEREAKANRTLLETFLARYSEASVRNEAEALPPMARIISRGGVAAEPSFPKRGPIILLSTLAGFGLGLGLAFVLEVMGASARLARERRGSTPVPGAAASGTPTRPRSPPESIAASAPSANTRQATGLKEGAAAPAFAQAVAAPAFKAGGTTAEKSSDMPSHAHAGGIVPGAVPASATVIPTGTTAGQGPSSPAASVSTVQSAASAAPNVILPQVIDLRGADATGHDPAYEPLLAWLRGLHDGHGVRRLGIAALGGSSLASAALSAGLARALARQGLRTALVDADFDSSRLGSVLVAQRRKGLADVMAGRASFAEVMAKDAASPLHVIQAGGTLPEGDLNASLRAVMEAMEQVYDMVVVHEGEARYPARRESSVLPHVQAAFVVTGHGQEALAESLCAALGKAGVRHCRTIALWSRQGESKETAMAGSA